MTNCTIPFPIQVERNHLRLPPESRVLPIQILHLLPAHPRQLLLHAQRLPPLIILLHPEQHHSSNNQDGRNGRQVQAVTDRIVRPISRQKRPSAHQPTNVSAHDVHADGAAASRVRNNVGADLRVGHGAKRKDGRREQKDGGIAGLGVGGGKEDDEADNDEGCARHDDDLATVHLPADGGQKESEESTDDIRGHSQELGHDGGLAGVDGADDGGGEEADALDGDVVEQENERGAERHRVEDAAHELLDVHLVEDLGGADTLRLDAENGKVLLRLGEPASRLGTVSEGDVGNESKNAGDDALNGENHAPRGQAAKALELEDAGGEETTEGTGHGSHDDVETETEGELGTAVPSREIVGDAGKHTSLESTEEEANTGGLGEVVDESHGDGKTTEAEGDGGDEPAGAKVLAADVGWDLENNVGDVEDGEETVVVVTGKVEIILETSNPGVADVCSVNEAEKVEQGNSGNDHEIQLPPKPALSLRIDVNEGVAISVTLG